MMVIFGSAFIHNTPHTWMRFDENACAKGDWLIGTCTIIDATKSKEYIKCDGDDPGDKVYASFKVVHRVSVQPSNGSAPFLAQAWRAPSWAAGPSELKGCERLRAIEGRDNAKLYRDKYQPESSKKCYYNPHNFNQVSLRCRDTIFPMNYIIGCTILPIGLFLFVMSICLYQIGGLLMDKLALPDESVEPDCCSKPCFGTREFYLNNVLVCFITKRCGEAKAREKGAPDDAQTMEAFLCQLFEPAYLATYVAVLAKLGCTAPEDLNGVTQATLIAAGIKKIHARKICSAEVALRSRIRIGRNSPKLYSEKDLEALVDGL